MLQLQLLAACHSFLFICNKRAPVVATDTFPTKEAD